MATVSISGKFGYIKISTTNIGFKDWRLTGDSNPDVDVTCFDHPKTAVTGQTVKQHEFPIFDGSVKITGAINVASLPWNAPMGFLPDATGTLILGLNSTLTIPVTVKVKKFEVGQAVDGFADFVGEFVVTTDPTYPANPL